MSLLLAEGLLGPGLNQQQPIVCSAWAHAGLGASGASVPGANTEVFTASTFSDSFLSLSLSFCKLMHQNRHSLCDLTLVERVAGEASESSLWVQAAVLCVQEKH